MLYRELKIVKLFNKSKQGSAGKLKFPTSMKHVLPPKLLTLTGYSTMHTMNDSLTSRLYNTSLRAYLTEVANLRSCKYTA